MNKVELEGKHIFKDPAKRTLFTMTDDNVNRIFTYFIIKLV